MNRDPCTFHRCKRDGERNRRPGYTLAWALKRGVRVFTKRRGLCFFFKSACGQIVVPRVYELSHCAVLDGRKTTGMPRLKILREICLKGNFFTYIKTGKINGKCLTLRCYKKIRIHSRTNSQTIPKAQPKERNARHLQTYFPWTDVVLKYKPQLVVVLSLN